MTNSFNDADGISAFFSGTFLLFLLAIYVIGIIINWRIFTKAGRPGWASIIPIYNIIVLFQICGMNPWLTILLIIPFVNVVIIIVMQVKLAAVFGKGTGFAIALIFFSYIAMAVLAFGSARYIGPNKAKI